MKYLASEKKFVCKVGYQKVGEDCLLIPKNKVWNAHSMTFDCADNMYEMKDQSCKKMGPNEVYDSHAMDLRCSSGYYRKKGICSKLPENSIFVPSD